MVITPGAGLLLGLLWLLLIGGLVAVIGLRSGETGGER
jgi:hypothetical protein